MTIAALAGVGKEVEQNQAAGGGMLNRVVNAIKVASRESGVDFAYLMNKAAQESGFRPDIKAKTSSATGLYQFTEQTWLKMVRDNGDKHGIGVLAQKIVERPDGSLMVKDQGLKRHILELRKNPEMAAAMAAEFAQDNKAHLQNELGGEIGNTELYMAHFLGASGATQFLQAMRNNPDAKAAGLLPQAAAANRSVFYTAEGRPRSVSEIYDRFAAKMDGKGVEVPADIQAQPVLLAQVGDVLSRVPELRLPAENLQFSASSAVSAPVAGNTAASLFSAMMLAQLDALGGLKPLADKQEQERQTA